MARLAWKAVAQCTMLEVVAPGEAAQGGFFLSDMRALGGYFGINPNDPYF